MANRPAESGRRVLSGLRWALIGCAVAAALALAPLSHAGAATMRPQIVGGQGASPGQFPGLAFVAYFEPSGAINFTCTGTVIAPKLVLTAGHCALDADTGVHPAAGGYRVITDTDDWASPTGRVESGVSKVVLEPRFNRRTLAFDAAILELSTPTAAPALPLAGPSTEGLYANGTAAVIAGWGQTSARQADPPSQLQWAPDVVQSERYCAGKAAQGRGSLHYNRAVQTCAIDAPSDATGTCHGDSGGPLLAQSAGAWVQIGVTSFGASGCSTQIPSFFTRTDAIAPWADGQIARAQGLPTTPVGREPRHPPHGLYRGRTRQGRPIRVRLARSGASVTSLQVGYVLRCRRRRVSVTAMRRVHWRLGKAHGFAVLRRFRGPGGTRAKILAVFQTTGEAHGLFKATRGRCSTGVVSWQGKR